MNQIELHKQIDALFKIETKNLEKKTVYEIIATNPDSRDYFFSKAPIDWITWLDENGFFAILNKEAEDKTRYSFRMPELRYLARVVEENGDEEKVVEIMNEVDCVKNFNPEVVDQFLWIAQKLSAKSLTKVIPKIKAENWIGLMKTFKPTGHTYHLIVKKLAEAKEYESLLLLAEVLLSLNEDEKETYFDNYFALSDVGYSEIFDALADLEGKYAEKGIDLTINILKQLAKEKDENDKSSYAYDSGFGLYDVNLFDMVISKQRSSTDREDLKSLLAVLVELIERSISGHCQDNARKIYDNYLAKLPDTHWTWRIQIFAMHFCPELFADELKKALARFFDTDYYIDFLSGSPEFYKVLKKVFPNWLPETEQRNFVKRVFEYFDKIITTEQDEKVKQWTKEYGWRVISAIAKNLTKDEEKECEEKFDRKPDPDYKPTPSITSGGFARAVQDRSPIEIADYKNLSALIADLKGDLAPEKLKEQYRNDDFLSPRNAEGVGNAIKEDLKQRMSIYLAHADEFIDPALNIHYTYSFLRGIEEYLRTDKKLNNDDWENLFKLFEKFFKAKKEDYRENITDEDRWLARWVWVEKIIAEIIKYFLTKDYEGLFADKRSFVLELLELLLKSEDPKPEHEVGEHGDLYHVAINSTRGVAFEAFVNFVYCDGEKKLQTDVLKLYKTTISEASLSVRFVIGHYLASFYYRDKEKIAELFEEIFPKDKDHYEDFFAAWQGYLTNTLYKELFDALRDYYEYALALGASVYPARKKNRDLDLDKGISTHLALAFAHFDEVQYTEKDKHPLLEKLWSGSDTEKQKEFVSFLGRGIISNGNASEEWFKEKNVKLEKLKTFWIILLEREDLAPEIYAAFGFWVNHSKDVFDYRWLTEMMAKTLEKSHGQLEWDYGTQARMDKFAEADPENALLILEKYLLEGILGDSGKKWFYVDDEKVTVFKILYRAKPEETTALINQLLEKGGRTFWPLKDVIED